jgi:hypothetical protein
MSNKLKENKSEEIKNKNLEKIEMGYVKTILLTLK